MKNFATGICSMALIFCALLCAGLFTTASAMDEGDSDMLLAQSQSSGENIDVGPARNKDPKDSINSDQMMKSGTDDAKFDNRKEEGAKILVDEGKGAANMDKGLKADKKTKVRFISDKNEYIGLILGYGGYFPIAAYGSRYKPAHLFSAAVPVYYVNFFGISPEVHVRYAELESKPSKLRYGSTISILQLFPALVYRYDFVLPGSFKGPVTLFARIYDGAARVAYKSSNKFAPMIGEGSITEWINVFGVSAGCNLTVYKGLFVGIEAGYSIIATSGKPMQAVSFGMNVGYKIF